MEPPDFLYDEAAVAIVSSMERAICRLRLPNQDQFVALFNAIEVQVESGQADPTVLHHLCEALLALANARGVDRKKLKLDQRIQSLQQTSASSQPTSRAR